MNIIHQAWKIELGRKVQFQFKNVSKFQSRRAQPKTKRKDVPFYESFFFKNICKFGEDF